MDLSRFYQQEFWDLMEKLPKSTIVHTSYLSESKLPWYYYAASQYCVHRCSLLLLTEYRGLSVCHTSEPCKMAEPIEMPFGLRTWVGPGNHVLDEGPDPPWEGTNFWGRMGVPL